MRCMGFDDRWIGWMECLFSLEKSSVLLNGAPDRKIPCKRGVRQGDPLSPLIFALAADLLQAAINDQYRHGHIRLPVPILNDDYPVIQYTDDMILVMSDDPLQVVRIKSVLRDYATSVGPRINFHKSTLVPINTPTALTSQLANLLGCSVGAMPFTYLVLPMGTTTP